MMKLAIWLIVVFTTSLTGCSSKPISRLQAPDPSSRAEIVVYRESSFNAGGVPVSFGADGETYATLSNDEYTSIYFRPASYNFFVRARTADPTILKLDLKSAERRCLKTIADPVNLGKVLVPILLMSSGYRFRLEEVKCPEKDLAKYSFIKIEYN